MKKITEKGVTKWIRNFIVVCACAVFACVVVLFWLNYRYGEVLGSEYSRTRELDKEGRYVLLVKTLPSKSERFGVYDVKERRYVLHPDSVEIDEFVKTDEFTYKLVDPIGRHFASLRLPCAQEGLSEIALEPHFNHNDSQLEWMIELGEKAGENEPLPEERGVAESNPEAFRLMTQLQLMNRYPSSPVNDLNKARAVKYFVDQSERYKGDVVKATEDLMAVSNGLIPGKSRGEDHAYAEFLETVKTAHRYDEVLAVRPAVADEKTDWLYGEYVAWHDLTEAMIWYRLSRSDVEYASAPPAEVHDLIRSWQEQRGEWLVREREILANALEYESNGAERDLYFDEFFGRYSDRDKMGSYHAMWYEVKPAFDRWRECRERVAESLDGAGGTSYRELTRDLTEVIFGQIRSLGEG